MSTMYDRIAYACKERGVTPGFVCDSIPIRRSFMTELKNGRTKNLSCEKVVAIAKELHVSCDYLILGEEMNDNLTQEERDVLFAFRTAPLSDRENIKFMLRNYMPVPAGKEEESAI